MIQDIAPHQFANEYRPCPPQPESVLLFFRGKEVLLLERGKGWEFPRFGDLAPQNPSLYERYLYLFSVDDERFYLAPDDLRFEGLEGARLENREIFRTLSPRHLAFAGITGFQLYGWYRSHRFCGRCGHPTEQDHKERMLFCPSCGQMEYPKICPAVIVAVLDGDRILLSKYAGRTYTRHALIAGFAEIGETIEQTVHREVMEEVGLKVKNLRFYKSQPWSFSDTLLMGFYCDLDGDGRITLDANELSFAEWFPRSEVPVPELDISLTSEMMMRFRNGEPC
ncbi:MAG: NAD(+) diphosphatase [Oscillospiraceae bacterium]|nr:MAG: NAD(+) diphosphatase [Oscillospiraceae bacterium]